MFQRASLSNPCSDAILSAKESLIMRTVATIVTHGHYAGAATTDPVAPKSRPERNYFVRLVS